ncbi:hypothetical protein EC973_008519, partial [Apophysomyces ossiformis]
PQQQYHAPPVQHIQPSAADQAHYYHQQPIQSQESLRYEVGPDPAPSFTPMPMPEPSHYARQGNI